MRKKISSKLNSKIGRYSLIAAASIAMLTSCKKDTEEDDANINDTDVTPDVSVNAPNNDDISFNLDINNDGITDVIVTSYNYDYSGYGYTNSLTSGYLEGANGTELLGEDQLVSYGGYTNNFRVATVLSEGNVISGSSSIWSEDAVLGVSGVYYGASLSAGYFQGKDKYVGVKLNVSNAIHYGWIRISLSSDASQISIKEYAFHIIPNTAIEAGDK